MSVYLVTDTDLASIANTIRTKGGTSASLAFPSDFVQAIEDIPSGGGLTAEDLVKTVSSGNRYYRPFISGDLVLTGTRLYFGVFAETDIISVRGDNVSISSGVNESGTYWYGFEFASCDELVSAYFPKLTELHRDMFCNCAKLTSVYVPKVTSVDMKCFQYCSALEKLAFPSLTSALNNSSVRDCPSLEKIDVNAPSTIYANTFASDASLSVLIIRKTGSICTLGNISAFTNTPFASGKSGGTLYVPSALVSSYQSATNWSTILGYANNQIKSIESTHTDPNAPIDLTLYYADGTLIPT